MATEIQIQIRNKLHTLQQKAVDAIKEYKGMYVTLCCSRQIGKSFLCLFLVTIWALLSPKRRVVYVTPTRSLGRAQFDKIARNFARFPAVAKGNKQDMIITFYNGSTIRFISAEQGDSVRGHSAHYAIIDEAAFIGDDFFEGVIRPMLTTIGKLCILISTPNGEDGFFYEYHHNARYLHFTWTLDDNPLISEERKQEIRETTNHLTLREEYYCDFLANSLSVFKGTEECMMTELPNKTQYYFAGIDIGRRVDSTVITIMNEDRKVVEIGCFDSDSWESIIDGCVAILKRYNIKLCGVEVNSIGDVFFELLAKKYDAGKLVAFTTTNTTKGDIIEDLILRVQNKEIGLPNDDQLIGQMKTFIRETSARAKVTIYRAKGNCHDDYVISLAIANHMYNTGTKRGIYHIS